MFGSVALSDYAYETLSGIAGVTSVIPATRIVGTLVIPQGKPLPAIRYSMTGSGYGGVVSATADDITSETVRFEAVVIDSGTSDDQIYPIAKLMFAALAGVNASHTFDGMTWTFSFTADGEIPLTTLVDGANIYRQLGANFIVEIFRA